MTRATNTLVAIAIVAAELASVGLTVTASAQETSSQQVRRQQRLLAQQQRQLEQNQRRLDAQERQMARQGAPAYGSPAPKNLDRGLLGNIGNCPVGWTYSLFSGCLPAVVVIH